MTINTLLMFFKKSGLAILILCALANTAHATRIVLVNNDDSNEGFNSNAAPFTGQTGNTGNTLGKQRLNVFQAAADYWEQRIISDETIRVQINFDPLFCNESQAVLGSAGPQAVYRDFPGAPVASTWYVEALANSLASDDLGNTSNDIGATFNSDIDNNTSCLGVFNWWLGIGSPAPANTISLYDTVLHEIAHGLGFLSLVSGTTGSIFLGFNDAYMLNLYDDQTAQAWPSMSNGQRVASAINTGNLVWDGANAKANDEHISAGKTGDRIRMYAPNPIQLGSSVSHWDTAFIPDELMEPSATTTSDDKSTIQLFKDIGWQIIEGPGEISFAKSAYTARESSSFAEITITRSKGHEGEASVNFSTNNGTAIAGFDYTSTNQILSWADGELGTKTIFVPISDDEIEELGGETFGVTFSLNSGSAAISVNAATVKILDPDDDISCCSFLQS